jgi:hypothetical protein
VDLDFSELPLDGVESLAQGRSPTPVAPAVVVRPLAIGSTQDV